MSGYIPNPTDDTRPFDSEYASTAAAEFRALKSYLKTFSPIAVTWNPADKASSIHLYSGNLLPQVVGSTGYTGLVRSTLGKSGAEFYYLEHVIGYDALNKTEVGVCAIDNPVEFTGADAHISTGKTGIAYRSDGSVWLDGAQINTYAPYTFGDVIGIVFSGSGETVFYKNGAIQGYTTWAPIYANVTKYPAVGLTAVGDYVETNFGASPFIYPVPSGAVPFFSYATDVTGYQNLLSNGSGYVDQRGNHLPKAPIVNTEFIADRWAYYGTVAGVFNAHSVISASGDLAATQGAPAYIKFTVAVPTVPAAGDYFYVSQKIEDFNTVGLCWGSDACQPATVLFYFQASVAGTYSGAIQNYDRSLSFPFVFVIQTAQIGQWVRVTVPILATPSGTWTGVATGLELMLSLGAGANYEGIPGVWSGADKRKSSTAFNFCSMVVGSFFTVTGLELRLGYWPPTTRAERPPIDSIMLDCQRYYNSFVYTGAGYIDAGINISGTVYLPTPMRVAPTGTTSAHANTNCTNSVVTVINPQTIHVDSSGVAAGGYIQSCVVTLDAEL